MTSARNIDYSSIKTAPLFPLMGALLLPRTILPLNIFEPRYLQMIDDALGSNRLIGIIQPQLGDDSDKPDLQTIGTLGRISHFEEIDNDRYMVGLKGVTRFKLNEEQAIDAPYRMGEIDISLFKDDFIEGHGEDKVDRARFVKLLKSYAEFADFDLDWDEVNEVRLEDLINSCSMASPYEARERQALLEADNLSTRAEMLMAFAEIEMARQDANITMQ